MKTVLRDEQLIRIDTMPREIIILMEGEVSMSS